MKKRGKKQKFWRRELIENYLISMNEGLWNDSKLKLVVSSKFPFYCGSSNRYELSSSKVCSSCRMHVCYSCFACPHTEAKCIGWAWFWRHGFKESDWKCRSNTEVEQFICVRLINNCLKTRKFLYLRASVNEIYSLNYFLYFYCLFLRKITFTVVCAELIN